MATATLPAATPPALSAQDVQEMLDSPAQLRLAFQRQVHLATGRTVSAEALARWRHPSLGEISPAHFIPMVQSLDLEQPFFERICNMAMDAATALACAGKPLPIAINASARTLSDPRNVQYLHALATKRQVPPRMLRVELTEDLATDDMDGLLHSGALLKEWGYELAIDDFGTGYANLSLLSLLPIQELKIDRSLVCRVHEHPAALEVLRLVLGMGKRLGLRVIAEGISDPKELAMLRAQGCSYGQGFLYGRPVRLEQFFADMGSFGPPCAGHIGADPAFRGQRSCVWKYCS